MDYSLLIKLIISHLVSDFLLQPTSWAKKKDSIGFKSRYLYLHTLITALTAILLVWDTNWIYPILLITLSHLIIDGIKGFINNKVLNSKSPGYLLLIDQTLHLAIITIVWLTKTDQWGLINKDLLTFPQSFWVVLLGYILVTIPLSVIIGKMTQKWNKELNGNTSDNLQQSIMPKESNGLANAGKWIGIIERILILTFILINKFTAIGFMLAAKSVFRFGDLTKSEDHKKTEYIIIGTFLSFMLSIFIGLAISYIIK